MPSRLSEIQISGAGAGKTHELANKIVLRYKLSEDFKNIYAITYTNSAKKNIESRVIEMLGSIPERIKVATIHSFLLEEVIYPYSKYVLGEVFNTAFSVPLPTHIPFKNARLREFNNNGIIHNEQVFKKSKQILSQKERKKLLKRR